MVTKIEIMRIEIAKSMPLAKSFFLAFIITHLFGHGSQAIGLSTLQQPVV
jgi:hypothetical protein